MKPQFLSTQFLSIILSTLTIIPFTAAVCECGYVLTATNQYFTHTFTNNFTALPDTTTEANLTRSLPDWEIQEYKFSADNKTGILGRQNAMSSVWIKDGLLHLLQKGYGANDTGPVQVAELQSINQDFFHGSFRARYRVVQVKGATGGSVAGFFLYYDDQNETDIEVLTKDGERAIHYTNHPSYEAATDTLVPGAAFTHQLARPWNEFHEHRFDWSEGFSAFYVNNVNVLNITKNVPTHEGKLILNVWANNGSWSGPPSSNDVYMDVEYILMYYNTTDSAAGNDEAFNRACEFAGGNEQRGTVCYVTDQAGNSSVDSVMSLDAPVEDAAVRVGGVQMTTLLGVVTAVVVVGIL